MTSGVFYGQKQIELSKNKNTFPGENSIITALKAFCSFLPERQWQSEIQKFSAKQNVQCEVFYFVVRCLLWASSA